MNIDFDELKKTGFTQKELDKITENTRMHGGSIAEAINDLANRFKIFLWFSVFFAIVFVALLIWGSESKIIGGGIGLLAGVFIISLTFPVPLGYKAWKYRKKDKAQSF
ncbi:hypothetical protein ACXHVK_004023 [Morganella morganii]|nr:hypothetical protein [Morganella morganii]